MIGNDNSKSNGKLTGILTFGTIIVLLFIIVIAVLLSKGILQFHWTYLSAPNTFWTIVFTCLQWEIYIDIISLLFFLLTSIICRSTK